MTTYIARRLLVFIPTLLVVAVLVFLMISLVPGDPVMEMLGMDAPPDAVAAKRIELGLDKPVWMRLGWWFGRALRGDLGRSYFLGEPVIQAVAERFPVTLSLSLFALLISMGLGVTAGIIASVKHGSAVDWGVMIVALLALSVPGFWLALNLIFLFAVHWRWFPIGGYVSLVQDPLQFVRHLTLPALSLGLVHAGVTARMTRSCMLEVLGSDYVRTARAKGLPEKVVIIRHALKSALIPIVTVIGISAGVLLGGSVIIETVYNLPGAGRLVVEGVQRRDYPVVQGGILFITCIYLGINLLVDILYAWLDPRIRYN